MALLPMTAAAQTPGAAGGKTFIDYFLPTPMGGALSKTVWGAASVGPRDATNGLEDTALKDWDYWDGKILKGADGRFHMFASRWEQAKGHYAWGTSKCVHAVSAKLLGPYLDKGLCWPEDQGGKGHNVTALQLPDGRYAIVVSETRPGDVFVSKSLDGPWEHFGQMSLVPSVFSAKEDVEHQYHAAAGWRVRDCGAVGPDLGKQDERARAVHGGRGADLERSCGVGVTELTVSGGSRGVGQRRALSHYGERLECAAGVSLDIGQRDRWMDLAGAGV